MNDQDVRSTMMDEEVQELEDGMTIDEAIAEEEPLAEENPEVEPVPPAKVVVKKEDEIILEYTIEDTPVFIGRKSDNHIVLEDKNVSRKHAQILKVDDAYIIRDLDSTGGTRLNNESVVEKDIHTGDIIEIGNYKLLFDSGIPEDERTAFDGEEGTSLDDGTALDQDRTMFFEEPQAKLLVVKSDNLVDEISIEAEELIFGREDGTDITIEDKRVSRQHCKIWRDGSEYKITDLGSSNGTFVNGQKVSESVITDGDRIQIGSNIFEFCVETPVLPGKKSILKTLVIAASGVCVIALLAITATRLTQKQEPLQPTKVILQKMWEHNTAAAVVTSPSLGDINGDGYQNIVAADLGGVVYGLDARQGGLIWNTNFTSAGGPAYASPLLVDINETDNALDVVLGTSMKGALAIDGSTMRPIWTGRIGSSVPATPAAQDINNDGIKDIFIGTRSGMMYCLDGRQGGPFWKRNLGAAIKTSPKLADLNLDGITDVVIGASDKKVYALNGANGQIIWAYVSTHLPSTVSFGDFNQDRIPDVAVVTSTELIILEGQKGSSLWQWSVPATALPSKNDPFKPVAPAIADLNGDQVPDVVLSTPGGHVYAVNGASKGRAYLWDYSVTPYRKSPPSLCDLNTDGTMDVIVGDTKGHLIVIDGKTGHQLNELQLQGSIQSSPVIGDLNDDGTIDIAVGTSAKKLVAVETETPVKKNKIIWNAF